jgi:nucleoid-associated protein YgaU
MSADTTTQDMASNAVSGSDTTQPTTDEAKTTDATQPEAAQPATAPKSSPTVLMSDASGVRVLQGPGDGAATLGAISFGAGGAAQLSGRGSPGGFVRVYLDDASVALAPVGPDGSWQVEIADLSSGILRLDEVDAAGQVVARVETAFERPAGATAAMTPATAEEQPAPQVAKGVTRVTVERGSTLWAIAREKYGDGVMYVRVFEANRDLIRDPDLIYPGQVFTLPE